MARTRALLTETERRQIAGEESDQRKYEAVSRVRARIEEELTTDVELLEEYHPDLLEELREVVYGFDLVEAFEIASGVLEVREQTRGGGEILPEDVLDVVVEEYPPEFDEEEIETVMHAMADAGFLNEREAMMHTVFENPEVEPSECEWCGAPFPEAGRHDVTVYNHEGEKKGTESICSSCISDRY